MLMASTWALSVVSLAVDLQILYVYILRLNVALHDEAQLQPGKKKASSQ